MSDETRTIIVEPCKDGFTARIQEELGIFGTGQTRAEAIGAMLLGFREYFPFIIENREIKCTQS